MAKYDVVRGTTNRIFLIFIQDKTSTTGAGLSGLTNTAITAYYARDTDTASTAISVVSMTAGTYTSGGFLQIDGTNMPGWYWFCPPSGCFSASGTPHSCGINIQGTGNAAVCAMECQLTGWDNQDAVHGGMSALPNTACTTNASLITSGSGTDQLTVASGVASADAKKINAVSTSPVTAIHAVLGQANEIAVDGSGEVTFNNASIGSVTGNIGGNVVGSVASVTNPVAVTSNIKKNSASRLSFTMTDSTNHAPDPGLTVAGQVSIDGAAFVPLTNAVSAIANGDYTVVLAAADTNGNTLIFRFTATGADDLNIMAFTQP